MWHLPSHIGILVVCLLVLTSSATDHPGLTPDKPRLLHLYGTSSCDCVEAIYSSGTLQFNLTSQVQKEAPPPWTEAGISTYIVSTVSMQRMAKKEEKPVVLSELIIPGQYLYERKINDIEKRIIHAAKDMLEVTRNKVTDLPLNQIVQLYHAMVEDLASQIGHQSKFSQGRLSILYHSSIAHAALRLTNGTSPNKACPPHQAYDHKGLFACQQEYSVHAQGVTWSPFLACKDQSCMMKQRRELGELILKQTAGMSIPEGVKTVEALLLLSNNTKLAEEIARLLACGNTTCDEPGCSMFIFDEGWHIFGADWGCCGDYPGCCFLATEVCLVHDAICTCCSFPSFCLDPLCHPDPWCSSLSSTSSPP